jgi:hypothetical protein
MSIPAISWWSIAYLVVSDPYCLYCLHLHAKSSAEINSIYAYHQSNCGSSVRCPDFWRNAMVIAIGGGITIFLVLYMVNRD